MWPTSGCPFFYLSLWKVKIVLFMGQIKFTAKAVEIQELYLWVDRCIKMSRLSSSSPTLRPSSFRGYARHIQWIIIERIHPKRVWLVLEPFDKSIKDSFGFAMGGLCSCKYKSNLERSEPTSISSIHFSLNAHFENSDEALHPMIHDIISA